MGIPLLSTFTRRIDGLRKPHELSNTLVVIDGNNLMYKLYTKFLSERNNSSDYLFGGNYVKLKEYFTTIFNNLAVCKITAVLVFDGGLCPDLINSRRERYVKAFNRSKSISEDPPDLSGQLVGEIVFPFLMRRSFISVATEANVMCFQSRDDPDLDMAVLANQLKCPVITNDSDFLVMTIDEGVIDCDNFLWQSIQTKKDNKKYIECKIYRITDFVSHFNLKPELLAIFASIVGNDRIGEQTFRHLVDDIRSDGSIVSTNDTLLDGDGTTNERLDRMNVVLQWLGKKFFGASHAIDYLTKYLKNNGLDDNEFISSIRSYDMTTRKPYLKELFDYKSDNTKEEDIPIDAMVGDNRVPKWFLLDIFTCKLDGLLIGHIDGRLCLMRSLVEDFGLECVYDCTHGLCQILLGLLRITREDNTRIKMVCRKDKRFDDTCLEPKSTIKGQSLPLLGDIRNYSEFRRKNLLFAVLGINGNWIQELTEKLVLLKIDDMDIDFWTYFAIVFKSWQKNTKLYLRSNYFRFVRALLLSVIYYRHRSLIADDFSGLLSAPKNSFKPHVTHYFCEFEAVYAVVHKMVSLLGHPIKSQELCHYLNGILFYNLFEEISANRLDFFAFKSNRLNTLNTFIMGSLCDD